MKPNTEIKITKTQEYGLQQYLIFENGCYWDCEFCHKIFNKKYKNSGYCPCNYDYDPDQLSLIATDILEFNDKKIRNTTIKEYKDKGIDI